MASEILGREDELASIRAFFEQAEGGSRALVLRGEAGIGKSTLWLAGVEAAITGGYRVLSSRPSEAETGFSFAALTDLLGDVADEVLPELPPIQRRSLAAALPPERVRLTPNGVDTNRFRPASDDERLALPVRPARAPGE